MSFEDIKKINIRWAINENIDKLADFSMHPKYGDYRTFNVITKQLIESVDFINLSPETLFSGDDASDWRIANA